MTLVNRHSTIIKNIINKIIKINIQNTHSRLLSADVFRDANIQLDS